MKKLRSVLNGRLVCLHGVVRSGKGMELVQVGILIAIAIAIGIIFKNQISSFVNDTFSGLLVSNFQ